jgi:hypothetical protein
MKSATVSTQIQNLKRAKKDFQELIAKRDKQLQDKIKVHDDLSLKVKKKIKHKVNLAKLSLQQGYQKREAQSMMRRKVIDDDYCKMMGIKYSIEIGPILLPLICTFFYFNSRLMKKSIELDLPLRQNDQKVQFCKKGLSEGFGVSVDYTKLINWNQWLTAKIFKY